MENLKVEELLFNEEPITINRKLAKCLGLTEAVIFQQIHYWLKINEKTNKNFRNGRYWTYNSIPNWKKNEFDFLSEATIQRKLTKLESKGLLISDSFNKMKGDKTKWYTINYEKLLEVCKNELVQKETLSNTRKEVGFKGHDSRRNKKDNTIIATCKDDEPQLQNANTIIATCKDDDSNLQRPIPETTTKTNTKITTCSSNQLDLIKEFELNICELRKTTIIKFQEIVDKYDGDFILAILEQCSISNIKAYAGFEKVFNSYLERNCNNRQGVEQATSEYRIKHTKKECKGSNKVDKGKKTNFDNFESREYDYDDLERKLLGWDKEE